MVLQIFYLLIWQYLSLSIIFVNPDQLIALPENFYLSLNIPYLLRQQLILSMDLWLFLSDK